MELTRQILERLDVQLSDEVVEFAPGVGATTQLILSRAPAQYTAIDRDEASVKLVFGYLKGLNQQGVIGRPEHTSLPDASATVVLGEATLTMQMASHREQIITEAARILKPGGRYGIHELCLEPDDLDNATKSEIEKALSEVSRVGTRPLTKSESRALLESAGFQIKGTVIAPFHLLKPCRLLRDEGLLGILRLLGNVLCDGTAGQCIIAMRSVIRRYQDRLAVIALVGMKPA